MGCLIVRRARFSAAHRYWLPELSEAQNRARFGPTTRIHGHNYVLFVSMLGPVDDYGMVLNLSDVKHVIKREVTAQLDTNLLNEAWPELAEALPTTEHLARVIFGRLKPHLPVVRVQLFESDDLWAEYQGEGMQAYLTISEHFAAAHRLALDSLSLEENTKIYGLCARPNGHGHNYHVEITVKGEVDGRTGMLVDLVALQQILKDKVLLPFDHTFLNKDVPYFAGVVPTAENIALHIRDLLEEPVRSLGATLHKVRLIESPNNSVEVYTESYAPLVG
ncbi:6-carboxytetrahydropterin synthase [Gloeobacter morelensis]|uniref:6-carboxy-5,6,7,8-tetrahydropterin synthase n=1 Tax=Gloeobacter morelensis MG652769 TaxID=2781736 RepID=A0ABY3PN07_9CYAN|nr:6-carboxytetrahydropterin synthase [Gloeobacter morelensis]UFP95005.1 6-carboxytetrahydropterin synthase [Gloeobacter morelensis MG652769]